ncbi:12770_t:CDS:2, partial [Racocetra persica]
LVIHEGTKHRNNKIIPHRCLLTQPLLDQIAFYQDAFVVLIKKRLENIFVFLFENESSFRYSPVQRKYSCVFQGKA